VALSEKLVARKGVTVNHQELEVSVSRHPGERFWRVAVRHPVGPSATGTAITSDDYFLHHLCQSALGGESSAWESLARWGHRRMNHPLW